MFERIMDLFVYSLQVATPVAQPCQNLKHIMITFDESEFVSIGLVMSFLSLPSISSLSCSSLVMRPQDPLAIPDPKLDPSAIKQLRFNDFVLDPEALAEILPNTTYLENFTYAYCISEDSALLDVAADFGYPVPNVHTALPSIASTIGRSLETLVLSTRIEAIDLGQWRNAIKQIDMSRSCPALKRLSVSTNLLLSEEGGDISKIGSKLPTSLECLVLHWVKRAPIKDINALKGLLAEFTKQAEAQLPSLKHLAVRGKFNTKDRMMLCPPPKYDIYSWHAFSHLTICLNISCDCTDWDTMFCSDIDWRHLIGDPNPGTYKTLPEKIAGSDD